MGSKGLKVVDRIYAINLVLLAINYGQEDQIGLNINNDLTRWHE